LSFRCNPPPFAALHSLTRWIACELDRPDTLLLRSPQTLASLERTVLAIFLQCLETNLSIGKPKAEDLASWQLKRVEEWLDCHFTEPVGVEEMATVAGVSVRSMQSAFRRLRGCTPTEALVQRRLDHARRGLLAAMPGTNVTTVALDSGFFHLGRFAARYALTYGESPSQTMARRRLVRKPGIG
jgi:AraC-like DNA-binding protein